MTEPDTKLRKIGSCPRCHRPLAVRPREGVQVGDKLRLRCPGCHATLTAKMPASEELRDALRRFMDATDTVFGGIPKEGGNDD